MGIFTRFFKKTVKTNYVGIERTMAQIFCEAKKFNEEFNAFLNKNIYYSRRSYVDFVENYKSTYESINNLIKDGILSNSCKMKKSSIEMLNVFSNQYRDIKSKIDRHNDEFVDSSREKEKEYFDNILKDIDPNIILDSDQRKAVLVDEDYCLIIAGAGTGKTTTVAAKVKYLVDKQGIRPNEILVISFTNKAVDELKEKINKNLNIKCQIATFHAIGNDILRKQSDEKLNLKEEGFLLSVVKDYLNKTILNETMVKNLVMFFGSYFHMPYEGNDREELFNKILHSDFSTLKSDLNYSLSEMIDVQKKNIKTINNESMRSMQEVQIANYLYLNGIEYEYEKIYPYNIPSSKKPYTPDFCIKQDGRTVYLEHFGITEDGKHNWYNEDELLRYKNAINDKIDIHKKHNTELIYTYSSYLDKKGLIEHLQEKIEESGLKLRPINEDEVYQKLLLIDKNKYISEFILVVVRFISNFKGNGYTEETFNELLKKNQNERTKLFLKIAKDCYLQYQLKLSEQKAIDFQDMINEATSALKGYAKDNQKLEYKYIFIDEYQDISKQRFDLAKELSNVTNAKIVAVGDDWQSVYAFNGSEISLVTSFCEKMGYGEILEIVNTYRNAQEVIDIAGEFVQKNATQIKKTLKSSKHIDEPVLIYSYDDTVEKSCKNGELKLMCYAIETIIGKIVEKDLLKKENKVLLIGRYKFDVNNLKNSDLFEVDDWRNKITCKKYPQIDIQFLTAHDSKGLGYDNVIIINAADCAYGFPCKTENDPVLKLVTYDDKSIEYAEERRLFYVAMTRTKNRVYMIVPKSKPSKFVLELKDYKNVNIIGDISFNKQNMLESKVCPICGYPLKYYSNNNYRLGLYKCKRSGLYMCTNEPEVCNFITNDLSGGKMSIEKCTECQDGYMIVKSVKGREAFLGCTNYKNDKTGCNHKITRKKYEKEYKKEYKKM